MKIDFRDELPMWERIKILMESTKLVSFTKNVNRIETTYIYYDETEMVMVTMHAYYADILYFVHNIRNIFLVESAI